MCPELQRRLSEDSGLGAAGLRVVHLLLAMVIWAKPRRKYCSLATVVTTALICFYCYKVMIGRPFAKPELFSPSLRRCHGETVQTGHSRGARLVQIGFVGTRLSGPPSGMVQTATGPGLISCAGSCNKATTASW